MIETCIAEKKYLKTSNKNQIRVKFSENDITCYPADSQHQVNLLVQTNGESETDWAMETEEALATGIRLHHRKEVDRWLFNHPKEVSSGFVVRNRLTSLTIYAA